MLYTTLELMEKDGAFTKDLNKFMEAKSGSKDTPIPLTELLEFADSWQDPFDNALWALRCCTEPPKAQILSKTFALKCAQHIEPVFSRDYPDDPRVSACLAAVQNFMSGKGSIEELIGAEIAVYNAAREVAQKTYPVVQHPAWAAVSAAMDASCAARDMVGDAPWGAWAAARIGADVMGPAEKEWQIDEFRQLLAQA